jgi:hypothetical protein
MHQAIISVLLIVIILCLSACLVNQMKESFVASCSCKTNNKSACLKCAQCKYNDALRTCQLTPEAQCAQLKGRQVCDASASCSFVDGTCIYQQNKPKTSKVTSVSTSSTSTTKPCVCSNQSRKGCDACSNCQFDVVKNRCMTKQAIAQVSKASKCNTCLSYGIDTCAQDPMCQLGTVKEKLGGDWKVDEKGKRTTEWIPETINTYPRCTAILTKTEGLCSVNGTVITPNKTV